MLPRGSDTHPLRSPGSSGLLLRVVLIVPSLQPEVVSVLLPDSLSLNVSEMCFLSAFVTNAPTNATQGRKGFVSVHFLGHSL